MNKIMLSNNISITNDNYEINNNIINIKKDGDYTFEYTKDINNITYNYLLFLTYNKIISKKIKYLYKKIKNY